jgi:type II secretory pathway pseudopilin PulG
VELLVAMAIASIVMAAIYSVYASLTRSYTTQNVAADVQQVMRAGIDFMAEDIMMAGLDPIGTDNFGFCIEGATLTTICITADRIDSVTGKFNGTVDETNFERITYEFQGNQIVVTLYDEETGSADPEIFIDNVDEFSFTYLDANGTDLGDPPANLADIRTVVIKMTVKEPAGRGGMVERTYTTRVRCRNIGL